MRQCLHISDTHEEDIYEIIKKHCLGHPLKFHILFMTGDMTYRGHHSKLQAVRAQMAQILADGFVEDIVLCVGNHETTFDSGDPVVDQRMVDIFRDHPNIHLLMHEAKEVQGIKIFGSPWTPWFHSWAFNYHEEQAEGLWNQIPTDTQILLTHGPPKHILDLTMRSKEHVGCPMLSQKTEELSTYGLKFHLFGHIHETYGRKKIGPVEYINSSIMTVHYQPKNKPQEFDFYFGE